MTQKKDRSEIKSTSTESLSYTSRLRNIYQAGLLLNPDLQPWGEFRASVKLFFPAGTGGIAFTHDEYGADILWIHMYCPNAMPKLTSIKNMFLLASCTSAERLGIYTANPRIEILCKRLGFVQDSDKIWYLRFRKEST